MKTLSRIRYFSPTIALIGAVMPMIALAQTIAASDIITPIANQVLKLSRTLVTIVFVLSIVAFGWGIVQYITSAGDAAKEGKARGIITWGVIGMAVGASIFGLITFLQTYFGVTGNTQLIISQPLVS